MYIVYLLAIFFSVTSAAWQVLNLIESFYQLRYGSFTDQANIMRKGVMRSTSFVPLCFAIITGLLAVMIKLVERF